MSVKQEFDRLKNEAEEQDKRRGNASIATERSERDARMKPMEERAAKKMNELSHILNESNLLIPLEEAAGLKNGTISTAYEFKTSESFSLYSHKPYRLVANSLPYDVDREKKWEVEQSVVRLRWEEGDDSSSWSASYHYIEAKIAFNGTITFGYNNVIHRNQWHGNLPALVTGVSKALLCPDRYSAPPAGY